MTKIEWNTSLSLGIPALDDQRRRFIELAGELFDAVRSGKSGKELGACLSRLREYTVYHFGDEEESMRSIGFPGLKAHVQEHEELKRLVRSHQEQLFREGRVREKDVLAFLKRLLVDHVIHTDMEVKRFLDTRQAPGAQSPAA